MITEQYRYFYMVAESGSISKAAKTLFVSQPAVTKAIKVLEKELGVLLFVRTVKGVSLTREGEILYDYVKGAFKQLELGEMKIEQLKNKDIGEVKIGISNILCKYYFIPHLKVFHEAYPKLKIEIINRTSPETLELLDTGRIDCAIISKVEENKAYHYHHLMDIQDTFVSKEKPIKEIMEIKELKEYPLLLLEDKNATRRSFNEHFIANNVKINSDIEISSMEFLVEFSKIGLGVAGVIKDFVLKELEEERLYEWKVRPMLPKRSVGLLYKKNEPLSIASKAFVEYMMGEIE